MMPRTKVLWNAAADALLRDNWMKLSTKEIGRMLGVSNGTVRNRANEIGLPRASEDKAAMSRMQSRLMKEKRGGAKGKGKPVIESPPLMSLQKVIEVQSYEAQTRNATIRLELAICDLADKLGLEILPYNAAD